TLATGTMAQAVFTVSNSGGTPITNGLATLAPPGTSYSILSGTSFDVSAGGTTNVTVQFKPLTAGGFTNNVIFTTANGGSSTNTVTGTGAVVPVAVFAAAPTNGAVPLAVTFTDTSSGTITNRFWSFGDAATLTTNATTVIHTYTSAGTNTVSLTVTGPVGASTITRTNLIVALNPPQQTISPPSRDFGTVTVGATNVLSFSVSNTGDLMLTGTATMAVAGSFSVSSNSAYTVGAGQTGT